MRERQPRPKLTLAENQSEKKIKLWINTLDPQRRQRLLHDIAMLGSRDLLMHIMFELEVSEPDEEEKSEDSLKGKYEKRIGNAD